MLLGKIVRDVVVVAGGVILGKKLAESPKVRKFARDVRDEVRHGLHNTAKEVAELADGAHAIGGIAAAAALQGLHLHVEIRRRDLQQAARHTAELPLGSLADIDVQPRGVAPQVDICVRMHDLVAGELVLTAVAGAE